MALTIEDASVELYEQAEAQPATSGRPTIAPPPDMDRILRELRLTQSRIERLWAD